MTKEMEIAGIKNTKVVKGLIEKFQIIKMA
jgi:hypothetical protein